MSQSYRHILLLGTALPLLGLACTQTSQPHGQGIPQGLYESCVPGQSADSVSCSDRLTQMASGGFQLILDYDTLSAASAGDVTAYFDQAEILGVKIILVLDHPDFYNGNNILDTYPDLASTCGCSDNAGFVNYVVGLVKNHPALWGYYVGDEVSLSWHDALKAHSDTVHQADPNHLRLYVAVGGTDTIANLQPFADVAEVLGADEYPIPSCGETIDDIASVAQQVQSIADNSAKLSTMVLQQFDWHEYPTDWVCTHCPSTCDVWPTQTQLETELSLTLANSQPQFVLWYSYFDIMRSDNPTLHWNDLVAAIR
jgi:hypothetical protein